MECAHHPTCPGCPLLDRPYAAQLEVKQRRLGHALRVFPHLGLEAPPVRPAARTEGYRHRLKLPLHVTDHHVAAGLYDRRTGRVLDTPDCPVLEPGLRAGLEALLERLRGHREVHALDLRISALTGGLQAVLACDGGSLRGGGREARRWVREIEALHSVAVSTADPDRKRVMGRRPETIAGPAWLDEGIGDTRYALGPGAFFQTDPRTAEVLHDLVADAVGDARTILDLYAGVGAYARRLAPGRERVVAVEEVPSAAAAAAQDAPDNLHVLRSRVEDLELAERFDVAILNPARRGSDPHTLRRLPALADRLVYVSCGPETLARDLDALAAHGFGVDALDAVDLFPQTAEVETVVHLVRRKPLRTWTAVRGGRGARAGGPWVGRPSGAVGRRIDEAVALVLGDAGRAGRLRQATFTAIDRVAGHTLVHLRLHGPLRGALGELARRGHPLAGEDAKTARFFDHKAGLQRPFVHVLRAGDAVAPLHGDLVLALEALGGDPRRVRLPGGRRR